VETIGSKRSYALTWCMPNNDDDDDVPYTIMLNTIKSSFGAKVFTGQMPFLSPHQQCQNTEHVL